MNHLINQTNLSAQRLVWPLELVLTGEPKAWRAPYVGRKGAFSKNYRQKEWDRYEIVAQCKSLPFLPLKVGVMVMLQFQMPIPNGTSKKMRADMISGKIKHTRRPDVDNFCKYALDILKGIVFEDDNLVFDLSASKVYSETPQTIIRVYTDVLQEK